MQLPVLDCFTRMSKIGFYLVAVNLTTIAREPGCLFMDDVEATILDALHAKVGTRAQLSDDLATLSIDSLAMAELALDLEQKLKIRLDEGVLEQRTVNDLVHYARKLVEKQ
jgi:acyl carrier protein